MIDPDMKCIVIDNGSGLCKCGFSGDDAPRNIFPTCVGRSPNQKGYFVGNEALKRNQSDKNFTIKYPIEHGMVTSWEGIEKIWHYAFYNILKVTPEECPVFLTESPPGPKNNREKMTEIMFESFNVPAFYLGVQPVLALYASGRTKGYVVDCGDGVTYCVPIYEGHTLPHAIMRMNTAGKDITEYLYNIFSKKGYKITREIAKDVKEKLCYVALDYKTELIKSKKYETQEVEYELPDGTKLNVSSKERFSSSEIMFNPSLIESNVQGIHEMCFSSIQKCDGDIRKDMYQNVVLSGGTTMIENFGDRLDNEILKMSPRRTIVKVHSPLDRKFSVWIGASIISSLPSFSDMWITKEDYDDRGPTIVNSKCL